MHIREGQKLAQIAIELGHYRLPVKNEHSKTQQESKMMEFLLSFKDAGLCITTPKGP